MNVNPLPPSLTRVAKPSPDWGPVPPQTGLLNDSSGINLKPSFRVTTSFENGFLFPFFKLTLNKT